MNKQMIAMNPQANTGDSDKYFGCSGCNAHLKKGDKYGVSKDITGMTWTGCQECCDRNNVIADKEVD